MRNLWQLCRREEWCCFSRCWWQGWACSLCWRQRDCGKARLRRGSGLILFGIRRNHWELGGIWGLGSRRDRGGRQGNLRLFAIFSVFWWDPLQNYTFLHWYAAHLLHSKSPSAKDHPKTTLLPWTAFLPEVPTSTQVWTHSPLAPIPLLHLLLNFFHGLSCLPSWISSPLTMKCRNSLRNHCRSTGRRNLRWEWRTWLLALSFACTFHWWFSLMRRRWSPSLVIFHVSNLAVYECREDFAWTTVVGWGCHKSCRRCCSALPWNSPFRCDSQLLIPTCNPTLPTLVLPN